VRTLRSDLVARLYRDRYRALDGVGEECPLRMLGKPALAVRGPEGARLFYDESSVQRHGAVPLPVRLLLFGPGAIHGLDDDAHKDRKDLFFQVVTPDSVARLADEVRRGLPRWTGDVTLFDELVRVYGTAVLRWAGLDMDDAEAQWVSRELALIVDGFGIGGTGYPRAALARARVQFWAVRQIRRVRASKSAPEPGTALQIMAGSGLPDLVAATELVNVLRPTVAVAYFGAPAAAQLASLPEWRTHIASGSQAHRRAFQLEMRRWYPFAPLLAARTRRPVAGLPRGASVILDILGTNRHGAAWPDAESFVPERFLDREPAPFDFVPQGGGDPHRGHRCPGEPIAEALLEVTLEHLAALDYALGPESARVTMDRIPALPPDRVRLRNVRSAEVPVG
jgi:fatty-acid peroxygenase